MRARQISAGQTSTGGPTSKAEFDAACLDGNFLYVGDVTQYTDELAQDAVGGILVNSAEIEFNYSDATPSITASIVANSIDETKLDASVNTSLNSADSALQPNAPITELNATNWRVFYSDGSGNVTELALGASGTYIKSNGTTSAPSFDTPAGGSFDYGKVYTSSNNITQGF